MERKRFPDKIRYQGESQGCGGLLEALMAHESTNHHSLTRFLGLRRCDTDLKGHGSHKAPGLCLFILSSGPLLFLLLILHQDILLTLSLTLGTVKESILYGGLSKFLSSIFWPFPLKFLSYTDIKVIMSLFASWPKITVQ